MGDGIAGMNHGTLQQVGTAEEVYRSPVNEFVADFIGSPSINVLDATVDGARLDGPGAFTYRLSDPAPVEGLDTVRAGIRPEDITLVDEGIEMVANVLEPMGNENFLYATLGDREITARIDPTKRPQPDETVAFGFDEAALYLFDPETGDALKTKREGELPDRGPDTTSDADDAAEPLEEAVE